MAAATIGEFINDGGRYPYMVLLGQGGLLPSDFMNVYTGMPIDLVYGIVIALFLFVGLFMATVYYALNKRFLVDVPSEPMNDA
jgi:cytochrome d ubiquinol oxidase subunit I